MSKDFDFNFRADGEAVLEVAKALETAVTKEPPFILTIKNSNGEFKQIVGREEFLEFYLDWAVETLYDFVDLNEK